MEIPISEFQHCYEEWKNRLKCCMASQGVYFKVDRVQIQYVNKNFYRINLITQFTMSFTSIKPFLCFYRSRKKYYYTLGVLLVGTAGVIGYAKYDPDFREVLTETIPGSDDVIKFVFEEEKPYMENINDMINHLKER